MSKTKTIYNTVRSAKFVLKPTLEIEKDYETRKTIIF